MNIPEFIEELLAADDEYSQAMRNAGNQYRDRITMAKARLMGEDIPEPVADYSAKAIRSH